MATPKTARKEIEEEIARTRHLLKMIPPSPFGDGGLSHRLAKLEAQLAELPETSGRTASFDLVFMGAPVVGSLGIDPLFAGRSLSEFDRFVDAHVVSEEAAAAGRFLVTGTILGSFGFRLEEVGQTRLVGESELARAVDAASNTLTQLAAKDLNREWFGALDAGIVHAARSFFEVLAQHEARVRFVSPNIDAIMDPSDIELAKTRVEEIRIEEGSDDFTGHLRGLRMESRDFDFVAIDGRTFEGRLDPELDVSRAKKYFDKRCRARIKTISRRHPSGRTTRRHFLSWVDKA